MVIDEAIPIPSCEAVIGGVDVRIIPPRIDQSLYDYHLEKVRGGSRIPANLTYDLVEDRPARILFRVDAISASQIWRLDKQNSYRRLSASVQSKVQKRLGNISIAKGIVFECGPSRPQQEIRVAVHKFGAVPVAMLPFNSIVSESADQHPLALELGVYPTMPSVPSEHSAKPYLLRSYRLKLDVILRKYLEDVAAEFNDIEHHSSRTDSFRRLKRVEDILASSVHSKTDGVLKELIWPKDKGLTSLAQEVWNNFNLEIMTAAHARVFTLYVVNELYRCLGVSHVKEKYWKKWHALAGNLRELYGSTPYDDLVDGFNADLGILWETFRRFAAGGDTADFEDLIGSADSRLWLKRFVEFARFVDAIRKEESSAHTPRLFVSAQHRVEAAATLIKSVEAHISKKAPNGLPMAMLTKVSPDQAARDSGRNIDRLVKARIWHSDGVLSVIPRQWTEDIDGGRKNLGWVASETEHGVLLKRGVHLFVEEGANKDEIRREFENVNYLSPATGRLRDIERRKALTHQVDKIINTSFHYYDERPFEDCPAASVDAIVSRTRQKLGRELVIGFLSFFSPEEQRLIGRVLLLSGTGAKKRDLAAKLAAEEQDTHLPTEAEIDRMQRAFELVWAKVRKRAIMIGGEAFRLIAISNKTYRGNLRAILTKLRPELGNEEIEQWHDELVRYITGEGQSNWESRAVKKVPGIVQGLNLSTHGREGAI